MIQLPHEIRNHICGFYYSTITLHHPHRDHWLLTWLSRAGAPISPFIYYENVEFQFDTTHQLVDFLFKLDHFTLCRLRYISVKATSLGFYMKPQGYLSTFQISTILQLFPGLQLDTLKVQDMHCKPGDNYTRENTQENQNRTYNEVERLIKSDGFRQVQYRSLSQQWLQPTTLDDYPDNGRGKATKASDRNIQPANWRGLIEDRDGVHSNPKLEAFQLTKGRRHVVREWSIDFTEYDSGGEAYPEPGPGYMTVSMVTKPVDVVKGRPNGVEIWVTRGKGVDFVQSGESSNDDEVLLKDLFRRLTWDKIKAQGLVQDVGE